MVPKGYQSTRRTDGRERGKGPGEIDKGGFLLLAPKTQSILTFSPVMLASQPLNESSYQCNLLQASHLVPHANLVQVLLENI